MFVSYVFELNIENLPNNSNVKKGSFVGVENTTKISYFSFEIKNINFNGQNNDNAKNENYHPEKVERKKVNPIP